MAFIQKYNPLADGFDLVSDVTRSPEEVTAPATGVLTAAQVANTLLNNYGQTVANVQTLPTAAVGMGFIAIVSTVGVGAWSFKAGPTDKIHLDDTALGDGDKVTCSIPVLIDYITFVTFKNATGGYDWMAETGRGTWIDGGA